MSIQAIPNPPFQPAMRVITSITNERLATVTTSFPHQYITGMIVRIRLPVPTSRNQDGQVIAGFGMDQINEQQGEIVVGSDPDTFTISIDTTDYDAFVVPPDVELPDGTFTQLQYAQVVPVGEINAILTAATRNVLPIV